MKLLISCLVLGGFLCLETKAPMYAQEPNLPPDVARTLRNSKYEHEEAMKKRFEPIIHDLSRGSDSDYAQLYFDAVNSVFFGTSTDNGAALREWQKKNKSLLEDSRLPLATQASALYLQGQLYLVLGNKIDANACFNKVLNILANGPKNLAGFHLMQESLTTTLLFKYYNIPQEYLDTKGTYCGSISQVEPLFKGLILPIATQSDPQNLDAYWNTAIVAFRNVASNSDAQSQKYAADDYPRLVLEESQSLLQVGQKKKAIDLLTQLLSDCPDSPKYKEISDALIAASTAAPAVSTVPATVATPASNSPTH
jgi:tetratricopeptide (TPR) repeat protein